MRLVLFALVLFTAAAPAVASTLEPGVYDASGRSVYVGIEHEVPDPAQNDYYDPANGHTGELVSTHGLQQRCAIHEEPRIIEASQGRLGASLYYKGSLARATVVLIHGADAETREMGFIIPYFVCNGINVISYDQRGVGESSGNWFLTGPVEKAEDVAAVYDAFRGDLHVDPHKIGVWGFSNGGWVAPIVSLRRPLAFMILKSAPTESVLSNLNYEAEMEMRRFHASDSTIAQALEMWHTFEQALYGEASWSAARREISVAEKQPWFQHSLMPKLSVPPPQATADGLRRAFGYDPHATLTGVTTPTLALYGALDRKLDEADSSTHMRDYLRLGARDVTIVVFPRASHTLVVSENGYDAEPPQRYVSAYPKIMLTWLVRRGFIEGGRL
jgi:pimeloyl-ACP methyl ester carboxylesterase